MSQRSGRERDAPASQEDFQFDPSEIDLKYSKNLMTVLDGYRIQRTYDLEFIDKAINKGDLPKTFIRQWGAIRSVLHKLAAIGPKVPGVESWLNKKQYIAFISLATLTIVAPMLLLTWVFQWSFLVPFAIPLAILAIGLMLINWIASSWFNRKVAWAIHYYVEDHQNLVSRDRALLKKWVQILIHHTARLMRKNGFDPDKNLVKFFNIDYVGIEVLKEPAGLRKNYVVKIKLTG
jgi:hypothetical protein